MANKEIKLESLSVALTPLQHRFVVEYVKDGNGADSARRAGCKGKESSFKKLAFQMLRNESVQKAIKEMQGKIIEQAVIEGQDIVRFFLDTAIEAREAKKFDAAVRAYEKIAEMKGLLGKKPSASSLEKEEKAQKATPSGAFGGGGEEIELNDDVSKFLKLFNTNKEETSQ